MSLGFFDYPESHKTPKLTGKAKGCEECGLYKKVKSPKMPYTGEGQRKVLFIGEGPGEKEDELNIQFCGDSGDLLNKSLMYNGFDLQKDFWKTNALACRPRDSKGKNREPTRKELVCCEHQWRKVIENTKPEFIFLLGGNAVEAFFMNRSKPIKKNLSITRWRKLCIPDIQTNAWIMPLFHPSFVLHNPDAEYIFKLDLKWTLSQLTRPKPKFFDYTQYVNLVYQFDELTVLLDYILINKPTTIIDYETSGLKPFYPGHKIWTASVAFHPNTNAYSFPVEYPNHFTSDQIREIKIKLGLILSNPEIKKVAQNIQMEDLWSKIILGIEPRGWIHDTMVFSHIEDEREGYTSLDFQTFVNWGIEYGEEVSPFKPFIEGTHFNRIHECPLHKLLLYGGGDAFFTQQLFLKQTSSK